MNDKLRVSGISVRGQLHDRLKTELIGGRKTCKEYAFLFPLKVTILK